MICCSSTSSTAADEHVTGLEFEIDLGEGTCEVGAVAAHAARTCKISTEIGFQMYFFAPCVTDHPSITVTRKRERAKEGEAR